ncbi:C2H2-type zinc finger transcription factor [Rhizophagus clarus]|uniref:C2H2-type zinc finger transcription factor n=1 Tax=Rhizophagus clarus TaxID=94130 RepID=A0A8H3MG94_9GLOM|nr:C2H2-type zinc finger transcription factor [Rhizophagus clarus]
MNSIKNTRWERRLAYFKENRTWSLVEFLQWSIVYANEFGEKQDEHLLYKICLEQLSRNPQLLETSDDKSVTQLASQCLDTFEKDSKSFKVKVFWSNSSTVMKTLKRASDMNAKSLVHQMLNLHYDFNEALSNTTRDTIKPVLKRKSTYKSENKKKKIPIDPTESDDMSEDGMEDSIIEESNTPTKRGKVQKPTKTTIGDDEIRTSEQRMYPSERSAERHYKSLSSTEENEPDDQFSFLSNGHESEQDINCFDSPQIDAESNAEGPDDDGQMSASDYEKFRQKYNNMETSKKWLLSTGTVVEDKLYDFGLKCTREHLSHSFILDPDDENYLNEGIFTKDELVEIRSFQAKSLPTIPKELLTYLNSFRPKTTADLRRLVFRQEDMDQNFDRQKDFDRDWIRNTVYNLLREYEANSLKKDHLEMWLLLHVWSFIDKAFENLKDVEAVRGESCSLASSERKNKKRTVSALIKVKRKILGRKGDLIIRKIISEYGCSEAGIFYKGENDTKLLRERGLKTPKMMKDMFYNLCVAVDWDEQKIRKMETIGFLHAGLIMMMLRLDSPSGYTCRISRSKSFSIPSQVDEFGTKALPTILMAWMAKTIVANAIRLVEQEDEVNFNEEDQLQQLLNSCETSSTIPPLSPKQTKTHLPHLPSNSDTPQKKEESFVIKSGSVGTTDSVQINAKKGSQVLLSKSFIIYKNY